MARMMKCNANILFSEQSLGLIATATSHSCQSFKAFFLKFTGPCPKMCNNVSFNASNFLIEQKCSYMSPVLQFHTAGLLSLAYGSETSII